MKAEVADWLSAARSNPLFLCGVVGALVVAALDQGSKFWIKNVVNLDERRHIDISGVFDLTWVQNYGASFGMLSGGLGSRILLSAISFAVSVALIIWLARLTRPLAVAGVAFIVGGALGNLYDRVAYGYVVDFLDFSGLMFPWVFNVADTGINVGIACLILDAFLTRDTASDSA